MLQSKRLLVAAAALIFLVLVFYEKSFQTVRPLAPPIMQAPSPKGINWKRFAYVQYVTNTAYLCNSVMIFESLFRLGSKAERLMMYPSTFVPGDPSLEGTLLAKARDSYGVKLVPIDVQRRTSNDPTWGESYTKLLAFNQTQYDRVLCLDSDSTVLQHMDELFLLPPCPVAMPRAYWLDKPYLSSQIVLVQPSDFEFSRITAAIAAAGPDDYDMEIVNNLYGNSALILPHRKYDLLTRVFREDHKVRYLGNDVEEWDPVEVLAEAKFLHFSDWPVPKPWLPDQGKKKELMPQCVERGGEQKDCTAQTMWLDFYKDFAKRRLNICKLNTLQT